MNNDFIPKKLQLFLENEEAQNKYPELLLKEIKDDFKNINNTLKLKPYALIVEEFREKFKDIYAYINVYIVSIELHLLIDDIKKDMKGPLKWLGEKGILIDTFTQDSNNNQVKWTTKRQTLRIFATFKGVTCKYVEKGTKEVPNYVLECN